MSIATVTRPAIQTLLRSPLTLAFVLANIVCFPIAFGADEGIYSDWFRLMAFTSFETIGDAEYLNNLSHTLASGQYWRLLTPMFLHFGVLHITFNLLWVWEFGRRIEWVNGRLSLLMLVVVCSLCANLTQYLFTGATLFGGMSGVVYGLMGFSMIWHHMVPGRHHGIPSRIYIFMLAFLVVSSTGVLGLAGFGELANGAHVGGLFAGLFIGLCWGFVTRWKTA